MLQRYSRKVMRDIWSEDSKLNAWLQVELYASKAWSELGVVPKEDVEKMFANAKFSAERCLEIEQQTKHDVVAFTRCVSESLGDEKKWVHYGLTSTDVVDTAYGYLYKQANAIIREDMVAFMDVLKKKALQYQHTPCIGRTHGVHADITCFGLKYALWHEEMVRQLERFDLAANGVECGKVSGAVGNFANAPSFVQDYVCKALGIDSANISTQTLQRDRHAFYFATLALIASTIEKIGIEFRHLQRTEVREAEESFTKGQKGSSAMPHKRNPISSENMAGCARIMRGYMVSAYENIPLWHERDISHSAAERILSADATCLLDYMLVRFTKLVDNMTIFEDRMLENIGLTHGVIYAQRVMTTLIDHKGYSREAAYDLVQPIAMEAWTNRTSFKDLLFANPQVTAALSREEIEGCFDLAYYLKNVEEIYKRCSIL